MRARLGSWSRELQDSLWFVPAVVTVLYALLALVLLRVDSQFAFGWWAGEDWAVGGADGSRGVLFAVAGAMLTIIGVVFSLTLIALQIASAQFTPRVMRTFTGDRGTQVVLGAFLGTFTYSLLVLRAIRSPNEDGGEGGFVPVTAVLVAIALAIVGVGFLIYYIHHVARSVQVAVIIDRVANDTRALLDEPLGNYHGKGAHAGAGSDAAPAPRADRGVAAGPGSTIVRAEANGYLQAIDADALLALAEGDGRAIRSVALVGEFILAGAPLADVSPAPDAPCTAAIRTAFVLGAERTRQQDAELGFRTLADIAIKALSPAINDPTTATLCLDRLGELLVYASHCDEERLSVAAGDGRVTLLGPGFDRLADVALTQIRRYGAGDPFVAVHLATALGRVAARVPPEHRPTLARHGRDLLDDARRSLDVADDADRVAAALRWDERTPAPDGRAEPRDHSEPSGRAAESDSRRRRRAPEPAAAGATPRGDDTRGAT